MQYLRFAAVLTMLIAGTQVQATTSSDFSAISEAEVFERYGRLDVSADTMAALAAELTATATKPAGAGAVIRYAGTGCPFATIQAAVNASSDGDTVRVLTGSYDERVTVFSKEINIVGGFDNCSASTPSGRSTIDRGGAGLGLDVFYPAATGDPVRTVNIDNFRITNGGGSGFDSGGGVIEGRPGRLTVNFRNVEI